MNELTKLSKIKAYTKSKLGADKTGHGYDHIKRVVTMACAPVHFIFTLFIRLTMSLI